jgi:hypothetical protein
MPEVAGWEQTYSSKQTIDTLELRQHHHPRPLAVVRLEAEWAG